MSSFPRNLFPITFRRPHPGNESPYNVDTTKLFRQDEVRSKDKWGSKCFTRFWCCFEDPEMNIYRLFYFIFHAAMALFAYLPLYYKQSLLLDHHHVGVLMGVRPFCKFLGAPCLGSLADKFNKYKSFLYSGIMVYILIYLSVTFVSGVPNDCGMKLAKRPNGSILNTTLNKRRKYQIVKLNTDPYKPTTINPKFNQNTKEERSQIKTLGNGHSLTADDNNIDDSNVVNSQIKSVYYGNNISKGDNLINKELPIDMADEESWPLDVYSGKTKNSSPELEKIRNRIFMILLLMTIVAEFFGAPILTLTDTATLQRLRKEPFKYGYQAVWGAVGFGLMSVIFGSVLHFTVSDKDDIKDCPEKMARNYRPVFYGYCLLLLIAFFSTFKFQFRQYEGKDASGCSFFKCVRYFGNIEYCLFIFLAWFTGVARGLSNSFLFVHLMHLGATPLILLVITLVQCLSSIVFYLLSPKFIVRHGYFAVLYAGLINYVVVFFLYSFIKTPWMVVPVEILFGISTSCVWSALVSYVGGPPKVGATLQGILHAMHIGLGRGIGGLFGGMLIVRYGFDWLFRSFSLLTFIVFLAVAGFRYWKKQKVEPIWKEFWDYSPVSCDSEFSDNDE